MLTKRIYLRQTIRLVLVLLVQLKVLALSADPIYKFDAFADRFLDLAFPQIRLDANVSLSYRERTNFFSPTSLEEVLVKHVDWHYIAGAPESFELPADVGESYLLSLLAIRTNSAERLSKQLLSEEYTSKVLSLCSHHFLEKEWKFQSVIEKALFQRDVFQLYFIFSKFTNTVQGLDPADARRGYNVAGSLRALLKKFLLTESEYRELTDLYTRRIMNTKVSEDPFDLARDYLPLKEISKTNSWYEMRFSAQENKHFNHYGGRSFVRVFARSENWSQHDFYSYWDDVQQKFGPRVHISARVPILPAKTQFLLLRTFAVLLQDGTVADSKIPEEVLIRAFKTSTNQLDLRSSDYRGTYFYVYKLSRRAMLTKPNSIGLTRRLENDPAFYGFHTDVPDLTTAHDAGLVSMRFNCIECHSVALYGSGTIFSLEKQRLINPSVDQFSGDLLSPASKALRYMFGKRNENLSLEK